jgi:hypothetical protein
MSGDASAGAGIRAEMRIVAGHGSFGVPGSARVTPATGSPRHQRVQGFEFLIAHFLQIRQHADDLGA